MNFKFLVTGMAGVFVATQTMAGPVASGFMNNDFIGDGRDRWQTGSYTQFFSFHETGPYDFDLRLRGMVMSPWSKKHQARGADRYYVEVLTFGAYLNNRIGNYDVVAGGDLAVIGDQTGLADLQDSIHDWVGSKGFSPSQRQVPHIANDLKTAALGEVAWNNVVGDKLNIRPYVSAQVGYETFLRAGVDFLIGGYASAAQYVRDPATGFVEPSSADRQSSIFSTSVVVGFDISHVESNDFLPEDHVSLKEEQHRIRIGLRSHYRNVSAFYGATYLSEEFQSQREGQIVGTVSLNIAF